MPRRVQPPYWPGPIPDDPASMPAYLGFELRRIQEAFSQDPVSLRAHDAGVLAVGTTAVWHNPFETTAPEWDVPGGTFDGGIWTVPQNGLYTLYLDLTVEPFGAGNKTYYASIRLLVDGVEEPHAVQGGADDVPLSVFRAIPQVLQAGHKIEMEISAVHEQFTGTAPFLAWFAAVKLSAQ